MDVDMIEGGVKGAALRSPEREPENDLRYVLGLERHRERARVETRYNALTELVYALGHDGKKYRREATQRLRAIVSEVYSAPRVTEAARKFPRIGILPGTALDLTTCDESGQPWDFSIPSMRRRAEELLDHEKPILLIGSPSCTPFSNIQNLMATAMCRRPNVGTGFG